jgi:ribA/ribD-fused uncharacterized protein
MGNMSPFPIIYEGDTYRTSEALFQALRFHDKAIRELIRAEKSPMGAKFVAKARVDQMVVKQLSDEDVANMRGCLIFKLAQHPDLHAELMATGDALIVEDVTNRGDKGSNLFWGAMLVNNEWVGKNVLGNLWMDIRTKFKNLVIT